jgi:integrase
MAKLATFKLTKDIKGGKVYWALNVPAYLSADGKKKRMLFKLKADAERKRAELIAAAKEDNKGNVLTNAQIVDARRALERLAEAGLNVTLEKAVELALPMLRASGAYVTVNMLIDEFSKLKAPEWRPKTARNFRDVARKFAADFGEIPVTEISPATLREWLLSFGTPAYAAGLVRTLRPAFSYALRQGMLTFSPFERMEPIRVPKKSGIDIFTPSEAAELMRTAPEDCKAAYALLLFAGVRPQELTRLKWSNIRDGFIHITPDIAKTEQVRNIEIEPTLQAWLDKYRLPDCMPIIPRNWKRKNQDTRRAVGCGGKQDIARHSYATYHLAQHQNKALLESNLGHSTGSAMLMRHYRAAATPAEAALYWSILP